MFGFSSSAWIFLGSEFVETDSYKDLTLESF